MRRLLLPLLAAFPLLAGCAHRVRIESVPVGAQVSMRGRVVGATPVELTVWSPPLGRLHAEARLSFPGYRVMRVDLARDRRPLRRFYDLLSLHWRRALGLAPGSVHEVLLVRRHGPVGTWRPEDVD